MAKMARYINNEQKTTESVWNDEWFMLRRFQPVVYQALTLSKHDTTASFPSFEAQVQQTIQSACIALLKMIDNHSTVGLNHDSTANIQPDMKMPASLGYWSCLNDLKLWAMVILCIQAEGPVRMWYIGEILATMKSLGLRSWDAALSTFRNILWFDDVLGIEAEKLGHEIESL